MRTRSAKVALGLLLICFAASVVTLRWVDRLRRSATLEETLYIPSPKIVQRMSLGYTGLMADIYWTRVVQYFGGHHAAGAKKYELLPALLDITTALDPKLTVAYTSGSIFLSQKPPDGAGMPEKAVELLERGIAENPEDWHLYYTLGFVHYMDRRDYIAAARAFQQGSEAPNAHPWLRILAANMAQRGNDPATAQAIWQIVLDNTSNAVIRKNAVKHLRALKVDRDIATLEQLVSKFRGRMGRLPGNFNEMVAAGLLRGIPIDPLGHTYRLMPDGRIEVASYLDLPFISKGLPPGQMPSQFDFSESNPPSSR